MSELVRRSATIGFKHCLTLGFDKSLAPLDNSKITSQEPSSKKVKKKKTEVKREEAMQAKNDKAAKVENNSVTDREQTTEEPNALFDSDNPLDVLQEYLKS